MVYDVTVKFMNGTAHREFLEPDTLIYQFDRLKDKVKSFSVQKAERNCVIISFIV